jgi:hypothetical protein
MKSYIVMAKRQEGDKEPSDFNHIADPKERRTAWKEENERQRSRLFPLMEALELPWSRLTDLIPAVLTTASDEKIDELKKNSSITVDENRQVRML